MLYRHIIANRAIGLITFHESPMVIHVIQIIFLHIITIICVGETLPFHIVQVLTVIKFLITKRFGFGLRIFPDIHSATARFSS